MDIKELRIGNIIERNGVISKIEVINNEIDEVYFIGDDFYYSDFCCNINPITITEEWLNKLGFEWSIQHQAYKKNGFKYVIDFYEIHPQTNCNLAFFKENHRNGETLISVKYVHQFQNLYFALTQTELTLS